jgi:hypothetical protein
VPHVSGRPALAVPPPAILAAQCYDIFKNRYLWDKRHSGDSERMLALVPGIIDPEALIA